MDIDALAFTPFQCLF